MAEEMNDTLRVEVKGKIVLRITMEGKVLVNEKERFTDKELAIALWGWASQRGILDILSDYEDSADWWKK